MNLSDVFSKHLQRPLTVVAVSESLDVEALTPAELHYYAVHVEGTLREASWRRGRLALRQVLIACGDQPDTGPVTFPHDRYSLTHQGNWALAVGLLSEPFKGIGIDYQSGKSPSEKAVRLFLTQDEEMQLPMNRTADLLRLWTVKEALFKADSDNTQMRFVDYLLLDATAEVSELSCGQKQFHYASVEAFNGWVTVAVQI